MSREKSQRPRWSSAILPVGSVAAVTLMIWQCSIWIFHLPPILLPSPMQVLQEAWRFRTDLVAASGISGLAALCGLITSLIVGTILGVLFSQFRALRVGFFPYVMFLQTVPIIGIAPLLIIWSGYQFRTVVLVSSIICLFPIINSMTTGLLAIDRTLEDLFRLYKANRMTTLWKLRFPTAMRFVIMGAKTSSGLAVIGAIVGDFFVGNGSANYSGLGTVMTRWMSWQNTKALIAAMLASAIVGLIIYGGVNLIASTLLARWTHTQVPSRRGSELL